MTDAWQVDLQSSKKLVLMALADIADDGGKCWPSVGTLAAKCSLSARAVRANLADLERRGLICVERRFRNDGSQSSNLYVVLPGAAIPTAQAVSPDEVSRGEGCQPQAPGELPCSPMNNQLNPPTNEQQPRQPGGGGDTLELKFSSTIPVSQRSRAVELLSGLSHEVGQQVLDEFSGRSQIQQLKNPMGYLRKLVLLAAAGQFQPELASKVRDARETRERNQASQKVPAIVAPSTMPTVTLDCLPQRQREMLMKHMSRVALSPILDLSKAGR